MTEPATLKAALDYAARGWQVFPLKPKEKEPATRRGFYDATTNPATLQRWFGKFPYNIGVRTGTVSGVFILDIDGDQGTASWREIEAKHGGLPATLISTTGKGRHFWFIADSPIQCSNSKIAANIDIKGDGGYVVCPPSVHPNGKIYQWIDPAIPPAHAPHWLVQLARKRQATISEKALVNIRRSDFSNSGNYGRAALEAEVAALAATAPGGRNHALNRCRGK